MSSTLPITTRPSVFSNTYTTTTIEGMGSGRTLPQGRISTLSSERSHNLDRSFRIFI